MDKINYPIEYPFNEQAKLTLAALSGNGRFPHGLIIEGEQGIGTKEFALLAARKAVCEKENNPCGICSNCVKALKQIHPDIIIYGEQGGEKAYPIDVIREIRQNVYTLPNEAEMKIYILLNADEMSVKSQNAMLKTIEEPPPHIAFILTCQNKNRFLETILSRVVTITLEGVDTKSALNYLKEKHSGIPHQEITDAIELANGNIGRAENILKNTDPYLIQAQELFDCIIKRDEYSFNKITFKVCKEKKFNEVFINLKRLVIKDISQNLKDNKSNIITPLQGVNITDIIDKGLAMNSLNANWNLLSAYIACHIFK